MHHYYKSPYRADVSVQSKGKTRSKEIFSLEISAEMVMVLLLILMATFGVLYLFTFNQVATKGYQLKRLELARRELNTEKDLNTLYMAEVRSMNSILESPVLNGMRKPGEIAYMERESVVASAD